MRLWDYIVGVGKPLSVGEYLLKAGRRRLVRKQIIDKLGRNTTKWVNPEKATPSRKVGISPEEKKRRQAMYQVDGGEWRGTIDEAKVIMASRLSVDAKEALLSKIFFNDPNLTEQNKLMAEFRSHLEDERKVEERKREKRRAGVAFSPALGEKPGRYLKEITIGGEKRDLTDEWLDKLFTGDTDLADLYFDAKREERRKYGKDTLTNALESFQREWKDKKNKTQMEVLNALARSSRSTKKKVYRGLYFKPEEVDIYDSIYALKEMQKNGTPIQFDKTTSLFFKEKNNKRTPIEADLRASSFTGDEETAVRFANDVHRDLFEEPDWNGRRVMLEVVAKDGKNVVGLDLPDQDWQNETVLGGGEYKLKEVNDEVAGDQRFYGLPVWRIVLEQQ